MYVYILIYSVDCTQLCVSGGREDVLLNFTPKKSNKQSEIRPEDSILNRNSEFVVVEAYKSIRTNIMYSMPKTEGGKTVVVTSASAGEGKTTTCINLALTFAQINARVLLIDCDLRKPKVHRYLKLDKKDGLSNVLCGFVELDKALKVNVRENLDVLTAGDTPPNPAELLQTKEFDRVMTVLKKVYDYLCESGEDFKIFLLPDHPTPIEIRTHSMEPVPFFIYNSAKETRGVNGFTEATAEATKLYYPNGHQLLDYIIEK